MMRRVLVILCLFWAFHSGPALAMDHDAMQAATGDVTSMFLLSLMELPFLGVAILYSFRTANALRGGIFGKGMNLMAWGLLVMAAGHLLMILDMYLGVNLLLLVLGTVFGTICWVVALILSWGLMGIGFHSIYAASRR